MAPYPYQYQPCARPFIAYLTDSRRPVNQRAHDCITIHIVRSGSVILTSGDLQKPIRVGDVTLIAPLTLTGYVPEGKAGITTLLIDTDYLIEHLFWQHLAVIPDRDAARDLAARLYPDPAQVLRLGEPEIERLGPILDELVTLSDVTQNAAGYFRAQALLFAVLEAISPHVRSTPVAVPPLTSHQRVKRVAPPRWRAYRPVRREAALAAARRLGSDDAPCAPFPCPALRARRCDDHVHRPRRDRHPGRSGVIEWHGVIAIAHAMRPARPKYLR